MTCIKKQILGILALSLFAVIGFGCDDGGVCTESLYVGNTLEAQLYYPCNISSPVGATTMSSGYTGTLAAVEFISEAVAEAGYVVLAFTPINTYGLVDQWRQAHKSCIAKLQDLNISHNVLRGKIDTNKLQTCGHSKGGGGSLWASGELGSTLKSTIGMAPYQGTEFSLTELRSIRAATFIQAAGVSDALATPLMTRGEYDALPAGISKCYKRHSAWGHMEWTDLSTLYHTTLTNEIVAWMKYYLDGDTFMADYIADRIGVDSYDWVK